MPLESLEHDDRAATDDDARRALAVAAGYGPSGIDASLPDLVLALFLETHESLSEAGKVAARVLAQENETPMEARRRLLQRAEAELQHGLNRNVDAARAFIQLADAVAATN